MQTDQKRIVANLGQMAVNQPDLVDLCFSSDEDGDSSFGEVDSSYDSILVLSQSDDPLPQVPWRFGKATRHDNVGTNLLSLHLKQVSKCIQHSSFANTSALGGGSRQ